MKVLVTGGAGYIGSHACCDLAQSGHDVMVVDDLSMGVREDVRWGPLRVLNILDTESLTTALKVHRPDVVLHFAGNAFVGESIENPWKYHKNNLQGTMSLLQAMQSAGIRKLVFSSSCATYGDAYDQPILETDVQHPTHPYGRSKWMAEMVIADLAKRGLIDAMVLRYFNAAGAHLSENLGSRHNPETRIVPLVIRSCLDENYTLKVFGTDFPTPDGTAIRDYVHVMDLAHAHTLAANFLSTLGGFEAINLGTGKGMSIREWMNLAESQNLSPKWEPAPRREGDPAILVAGTGKASSLLNWSPRFSNPETIFNSALRWHAPLFQKGL